MSLLRTTNVSPVNERPSVLVELKLHTKNGEVLDAEVAFKALVAAFKSHPTLEVYQAKISPDKDSE